MTRCCGRTGGSTGVRGVIVGDQHSFGAFVGSDLATGLAQAEAGPRGVECSKVLLTHLHNHVQPLIRYEISDRSSWAEPPDGCPWEGQWLKLRRFVPLATGR